ncbi:PAS domain-containing protein, partial [Parabacteroides sp. OttesenSCG-928-K15]|nr:PAS domain-containing protein [Parabacteroides sp. OttesenSCG-928-K15]
MKTKWVFIVIVLFITAVFMTLGFLFFRNEPFPFWAMQCIAVASVLFSIFLYKKLVKPYLLILNGMELLKEQDFSTHLRPVKNKDANELIDIFNRMITHLRNERLQVRERNQFLDLLINASPQGIIILNFDKQITDINTAGLKLLGLHDLDEVKGKRFVDANFPLAPALAGLKLKDDMILRGEGATVYRCVYSSFVDQGFNHPFVLIEELTNELLRIEKESYERIIRMMSHEVNNSVGAIGSTLNVVSDIFRQERGKEMEDVLFAVDASYDRCRNLTEFISDLANIIRIPEPSLSTVSLNEQIRAIEGVIRLECQRR